LGLHHLIIGQRTIQAHMATIVASAVIACFTQVRTVTRVDEA